MRIGCRLLVLLALLSALLGAATTAAAVPSDPRDDKKRIDAELAQAGALLEAASAQVQHAVTQLAELNQALPVAAERAAQARGTVAAAENQVATSQRHAEAARAGWESASRRYDEATDRVREGRERLGRFVTITHQGGEIAQFNVLIAAGDPRDLAVRMAYTRKIADAKKGTVDQLIGALREAKQVSNEATLAKRAADQALADAKAAVVEAAAAREDAERTQRELAELAQQQRQAAESAEAHRADVLRRHEELKRESERIAAELLAWEQANGGNPGPVLRPDARLLMPVRGWKSSAFGMRYDPYYNVWQLHAGVDIAAGGGEPIYAAADGRVASAGWRGGYGNYTCLSHGTSDGRSLSTCYAHQSRILVNHGQHVSRGQMIGRVGTTGASTGNHLHFEVRLDGGPVEPENWLPGCLC